MVFLAVVFLAVVFLAVVFLAVVFLAVVFLAVVFLEAREALGLALAFFFALLIYSSSSKLTDTPQRDTEREVCTSCTLEDTPQRSIARGVYKLYT